MSGVRLRVCLTQSSAEDFSPHPGPLFQLHPRLTDAQHTQPFQPWSVPWLLQFRLPGRPSPIPSLPGQFPRLQGPVRSPSLEATATRPSSCAALHPVISQRVVSGSVSPRSSNSSRTDALLINSFPYPRDQPSHGT